MEIGAMHECRDVVSRTLDGLSMSHGLPGGIRCSLPINTARYGIAIGQYSDYTGSVYEQTLREVKDPLFWRKHIELYNITRRITRLGKTNNKYDCTAGDRDDGEIGECYNARPMSCPLISNGEYTVNAFMDGAGLLPSIVNEYDEGGNDIDDHFDRMPLRFRRIYAEIIKGGT